MATCSRCGQRRGKRNCPVTGALCPECCGVHRRRDIPCPDDCSYLLSGLDSANEVHRRAAEGLRSFLLGEETAWANRAAEAFLDGDPGPGPWDESCHLEFVYLGWEDERGERGVDRYLRLRGAELRSEDRAAVEMLRDRAWVSLFEIDQVLPEMGLRLVDRLDDRRVFVRERMGTRGATAGDHLIAWVVDLGDRMYVLTGAVCPVAPAYVDAVKSVFADAIAAGRRDDPDADARILARRAVPRVHRALRQATADLATAMLGPESDGATLFRAHFEVTDREAVQAKLAACPELERVRDGLFTWSRSGRGAERRPDDFRGEIELRTVRLSVIAMSRARLDEGKRFVVRLLGRLIQPRAEEDLDLLDLAAASAGGPRGLADGNVPAPGFVREPPSSLPANVDDTGGVAESIGGFHRELGEHIRRSEASPSESPSSDAEPAPPDGDPDRGPPPTEHRLPQMAHEAMDRCTPGFARAVKEALASLRGELLAKASGTIAPGELQRVTAFQVFLEIHVTGLIDQGASEEAARADAVAIAHHFLYAINFELHGRKTFWVDESLAWMLGRTDLDIIGRCLRLPFASCAFVFTDRVTLELGESLLALDASYRSGGRKLAILTTYLFGEEATEGDDRPVGVHLLFDTRSGDRPYHVGRSLYVRPDDHLESILDSHHPDVSPAQLDAFLHAPELKRLVHLVVNAVLYATSAHLEPIVLAPATARLEREANSAGGAKRRRRMDRLLRSAVRDSQATVFFLPGYIDISRVRRYAALERTEDGRALMSRFMVRGHWRRAGAVWKDQRLRWIRPYWKGPEMAAVVERAYRLKP